MKNKILTGLFALGLSLTLAACGGGGEPATDEGKVLADADHAAWCLHGQFMLKDGETVNGWNGKSDELYEASKMTATSIKDVKAINAEVGKKLASKNVKYLYKYEGAVFGVNDAGWTAPFAPASGEGQYLANGSYVFKAAQLTYDEDDKVYSEDLWIPDPKKAHAEALDENLFIPPWREEVDEEGFSWASNQVVRGGAGKYTIIVAQYKETSAATVPGFGIAVVKTGSVEGGRDYVKQTDFTTYTSWGVVGTITDWSKEGTIPDIAMTPNAAKTAYTATVDLTETDAFKVRPENKWENDQGFAAVDTKTSDEGVKNSDGNIAVTEAGKYVVTLTVKKYSVSITVVKALAA